MAKPFIVILSVFTIVACSVELAMAEERPAFTERSFDDLIHPPEHMKIDPTRITDRVNFNAVHSAQADKDQCTADFIHNRKMTDYYKDFTFTHQDDWQKTLKYKALQRKVKAYLKTHKDSRGYAHYSYTKEEAKVVSDYQEFTDRINDFIELQIRRHCLQQEIEQYMSSANVDQAKIALLADDVNKITGTFMYQHVGKHLGLHDDELKDDSDKQMKLGLEKRVYEREVAVAEKWVKSYDAEIAEEGAREGFSYKPKEWKPARAEAGMAD